MDEKKLSDCRKGDRSENDNLVERSTTNEKQETISLWKNKEGNFQVSLCDDKKSSERNKWGSPLVNFQHYVNDDLPWALYEACCDVYGCSPYPEAEAYYRRKGCCEPQSSGA